MMSRSLQSVRRLSIPRSVEVAERRLMLRPSPQCRIVPQKSLRSFSSGGGGASDDPHALFKDQMEDLAEEREAMYGFSDEDRDSWSNGGQHKHDHSSFLEQIEQARVEESRAEEAQVSDPVAHEAQSWSSTGLSHLSQDGKDIHMVDIGLKTVTQRVAVAQSTVFFPPEVMQAFGTTGAIDGELVGPKGPIFATAKLAGIMAAKKTSDLIPLCHPLPLDQVNIDIRLENGNTAVIRCECRVTHKTGVEMEALTGASVAALTIYDMTKALSHQIRIEQTMLITKTGGKRTVGTEE